MWVPRDERPCDPKIGLFQCSELPITPQLGNIAINFKGGIPYQPWAAELVKKRANDVGYIDPHTFCMPINYPRAWAYPETQKIFQTPTELVLLHEFNASYRQIFFDGRKLPGDMTPAWNGYSVAHWEGDTCRGSAGYRDDSWLDTAGNFFSSQARVTEPSVAQFSEVWILASPLMTPKCSRRAWTVELHMKPMVDTEMIEYMCEDNNKDSTLCSIVTAIPNRSRRRTP